MNRFKSINTYSEDDRWEARMKAHIQDCNQLEARPVEGH